MATFNKVTGKYESRKLIRFINLEIVGSGDTKQEAIEQRNEDLRYVREALRKKELLVSTGRNTFARPDLAKHIIDSTEKKENEK